MFPQDELRLGCDIPSVFHTIEGTCRTRVAFRSGSRTAVVTFSEYRPSRKFRSGGSAHRTLHHSWSFEVQSGGLVVSLGNRGDFPPQWAQ